MLYFIHIAYNGTSTVSYMPNIIMEGATVVTTKQSKTTLFFAV